MEFNLKGLWDVLSFQVSWLEANFFFVVLALFIYINLLLLGFAYIKTIRFFDEQKKYKPSESEIASWSESKRNRYLEIQKKVAERKEKDNQEARKLMYPIGFAIVGLIILKIGNWLLGLF